VKEEKTSTMSGWSERDLAQLNARGSTVAEVERQIAAFRSGFPPTVLVLVFFLQKKKKKKKKKKFIFCVVFFFSFFFYICIVVLQQLAMVCVASTMRNWPQVSAPCNICLFIYTHFYLYFKSHRSI
jgi:hypothetical protein